MGTEHDWKCTACGCGRAMSPAHVRAIKSGGTVGFPCLPHRCDCWDHVPGEVPAPPVATQHLVDAGPPSDPRHLVGTRWLTGGGVVLVAGSTTWTPGSNHAAVALAGPSGAHPWPAVWHHAVGAWRMLELEPAHDTSNPYLLSWPCATEGERHRLCVHCGLAQEGPWQGAWCRPAPAWRAEYELTVAAMGELRDTGASAAQALNRFVRRGRREVALASLGGFPGGVSRRQVPFDGCWDVRPERS